MTHSDVSTASPASDSSPTRPEEVQLLRGTLVRLAAWEPEQDAKAYASWSDDIRFVRLGFDSPARPLSVGEARANLERRMTLWPESVEFAVRPLEGEGLLGEARLYDIQWNHRTAVAGLGIGRPDDWGKGYGTDVMRLLLRYGFDELNLHRIWLDTFGYNERAIAMYRRLGFVEEGRLREHLERDGRRYDVVLMGMLRDEYETSAATAQP